jgi:TonB family protein
MSRFTRHHRRTLLAAALLTLPASATAQPDAGTGAAAGEAAARRPPAGNPAAGVEPPRLLAPVVPVYPDLAARAGIAADVALLLTVDTSGAVSAVELVEPRGSGFDEAAIAAARQLRFAPARRNGLPVAVRIRYTVRFRPPARPRPVAAGQARLTVEVVGPDGRPLVGVRVTVAGYPGELQTDARGRVTARVTPGPQQLRLRAHGYRDLHRREAVASGEAVLLRFRLAPAGPGSYHTEVWGQTERRVVATTELEGAELTEIPGTLGEPIRVVMLMPGVTSSMSGASFPIVRGAMPAETRYDIDGIDIPMLYHLMLGTSVLHPRITSAVDFQPAGFTARAGRATGGSVSASMAAPTGTVETEARLSLVDAAVYHGQPLGSRSDILLATKAGTVGGIALLFDPRIVLSYVDYQLRLVTELDRGRFTATAIGAFDLLTFRGQPAEDGLLLGFNRLDLRYDRGAAPAAWRLGLQLGHDQFNTYENDDAGAPEQAMRADPAAQQPAEEEVPALPGPPPTGDAMARSLSLRPYLQGHWAPGAPLALLAGADLRLEHLTVDPDLFLDGPDDAARPLFTEASSTATAGAWLELHLALGRLTAVPSARVDHYLTTSRDQRRFRDTSFDPRLNLAYRLAPGTSLQASAGLYHGPPRLNMPEEGLVIGPIPASSGLGAAHGLDRAVHYQAGVDSQLGPLQGRLTGFWQETRYAIDLAAAFTPVLPDDRELCAGTGSDEGRRIAPVGMRGRSRGVELMLRRRVGERVFGWASYTLSWADRQARGGGRFRSAYDQRHVLNTAVSWQASRHWTLGATLHAHSGRPTTPEIWQRCSADGEWPRYDSKPGPVNSARVPGFWRVDVRAERHFQFRTFRMHLFLDLFNVALRAEPLDYDYQQDGTPRLTHNRLVLPMLGVRGEF